jgi:transcriptional regulator of arginine metabolism
MKIARHARILELIRQYEIETQEELASKLNESGFSVTQATVSRDIRELKLTKVQGENGKVRYVVTRHPDQKVSEKYVRVLKDAFVSMDVAGNILVVKTASGMAMAAAAALDELDWNEIVGCIAGDNTIMCAIRSQEEALRVMEKLKKMLDTF